MGVGALIKTRRKELYLTQGELAEGICTQAMISKIEREDLDPNGSLVDKIAKKLRVTVSYFYGEQPVFSEDKHLTRVKELIYEEMSASNFDRADLLMETNKDLIKMAVALEDKYFFNWIEGCLYYYRDFDSKKALKYLKSIPIKNIMETDLAFEITSSIASIYSHESDKKKALEIYEKANFMQNKHTSIEAKAKFIFNFALTLKENEQYKRSLGVTLEGIDIIQKNHSLLSLGNLYWLKGILFDEFSQYEEAIEAYKTALMLFKIQNNEHKRGLVLIDLHQAKDMLSEIENKETSDNNE